MSDNPPTNKLLFRALIGMDGTDSRLLPRFGPMDVHKDKRTVSQDPLVRYDKVKLLKLKHDSIKKHAYTVAFKRFQLGANEHKSTPAQQRVLHTDNKFAALDANEDGKVSLDEFEGYHDQQGLIFSEMRHHLWTQFSVYDRDKSGSLRKAEIGELFFPDLEQHDQPNYLPVVELALDALSTNAEWCRQNGVENQYDAEYLADYMDFDFNATFKKLGYER